jgi:hypothetical protein
VADADGWTEAVGEGWTGATMVGSAVAEAIAVGRADADADAVAVGWVVSETTGCGWEPVPRRSSASLANVGDEVNSAAPPIASVAETASAVMIRFMCSSPCADRASRVGSQRRSAASSQERPHVAIFFRPLADAALRKPRRPTLVGCIRALGPFA